MNKNRGFTLIEVIVVIGSLVIILPALFSIIFSLLRQQVKIYQLSEVKRQGDNAISIIENNIRLSALSIHDSPVGGNELCANVGDVNVPVAYFRDSADNWFQYVLTDGKIASQSQIANASTDLSTERVTISSLVIRCSRTARYSTPIVDLQFIVSIGDSNSLSEERAQMTYQTRIKLRNQ